MSNQIQNNSATMRGNAASGRAPWLKWLVLVAVMTCMALPYQPYENVNESSRLYFIKAVVERGVLHIDHEIEKYGDIQDKAVSGDHYYSEKPVGLSALAIPAYFVLYQIGDFFDYDWPLDVMRYVLTLLYITLPTIFLLALLWRHWMRITASSTIIAFAILAYALGTITFTYSTQFMGHQLAAVLAFAHFYLSRDFVGRVPWWKMAMAGALAGVGAMTEYFSAIVHVVIMLGYVFRLRPFTLWIPLIVSGLITFAPLPIYNYFLFGDPLRMAYAEGATTEFRKLHNTGFFGVTLFPRVNAVIGLFFSFNKGLLALSPFLALGFVGLAAALFEKRRRRDAIVLSTGTIIIIWLACAFLDWRAGWTVGPRHMITMLPLLMTGVVMAVERWRGLMIPFVGSALFSIFIIGGATWTLPAFEVNLVNAVRDQAMFLLFRGVVAPSVASWIGLPSGWNILLPGSAVVIALGAIGWRAWRNSERPSIVSVVVTLLITAGLFGVMWRAGEMPPAIRMYYQSKTLHLVERTDESIELLENAIRERPQRDMAGRAFPLLLQIHAEREDRAAAIEVVNQWLEIDPYSVEAMNVKRALEAEE